MERLMRWGVVLLGGLGATGLMATQAQAAGISIPVSCVVVREVKPATVMPVTGTGFTPGDDIDIESSPGSLFTSTTAASDGTFGGGIPLSPFTLFNSEAPQVGTFTLTATDEGTGAVATAQFEAATLAVVTKPTEARANRKVTFSFSGFRPGKEIYAHYLRKGKVTATAKFGRATGPCGTLRKRAHFYPGRERYDRYTVQFDNSKRYSHKAEPQYRATVTRTVL